jgi:hypothetical protein
MNHLTLPPFLLLPAPSPKLCTAPPCNTLLLHSTIFNQCALDKQSKANLAHIHTHTQNPCCTSTIFTLNLLTFLGWVFYIFHTSILTYLLLFFFWFYLSSVVEVKGKRERLLFVKLLQSSLLLAITMSSTVRPCLHFLYLRYSIVVESRPTVSRGAMNTDKTHTAVTCTTTKTLKKHKKPLI